MMSVAVPVWLQVVHQVGLCRVGLCWIESVVSGWMGGWVSATRPIWAL